MDSRFHFHLPTLGKLIFTFFLFANEFAQACPLCAGSSDNPRDGYIVYILMGFIALTYIPFYILYRTIIKNRNSELILDEK